MMNRDSRNRNEKKMGGTETVQSLIYRRGVPYELP